MMRRETLKNQHVRSYHLSYCEASEALRLFCHYCVVVVVVVFVIVLNPIPERERVREIERER